MTDIRRVLVVGGGVGGLTAATAFARRGVEVVLIERRPAFDVPGVGLGQPANALRVYEALGVLRYARCAFVYTFSCQWMEDEQSIRTSEDFAAARLELAMNASARIAASDRILNSRIV